MYNDDYRDPEQLDEINYYDESCDEDFRDEDTDEFVEFTPPYGCPFYRQQFPGGFMPPRPPFGPPGGGPGGFPGGPGSFPGGPGGGHGGVPQGPPPSFTPSKSQAKSLSAPGGASVYAVDAGSLRPCLYKFTYLWLRNGNSFWAYLTYVGRRSVSGYRWDGRRWVYFGIDTNRIDYFICY